MSELEGRTTADYINNQAKRLRQYQEILSELRRELFRIIEKIENMQFDISNGN